ncbi:hypothetical protein ACFFMR_17375 [Micromonospora andamanensis]|uniref:Uncharacterized protein n=1 Tax=Micromonospora andamanensis TaxID=1287068 RepID=A0ABQ4HZ30_9ACTN|nr:hypothetical protein [Micromonospora andamanensis]GIJ10908.1 hypothetical protein Van01_41220 [Micromonospora andamanensis]
MSIRRSGRLAVVPLLLLTSAACGQQAGGVGSGEADQPERSYSADAVVFRMDHTGGFVTPAMLATRLPAISVYGDGRVITQGPVPMIYPGPSLPNLQLGTISATQVEDLLKAARAAGVGGAVDLGRPPVADAPSTRFTVLGDNGVEEFEVYALAESGGAETGLTADQRAGRDKLREFADSLTAEAGPLAAAQADPQPYAPTAVAAVAEPWVANADVGQQPEVAWPGPALPGPELGEGVGLGCVTVTGDEAQRLLTAAAAANAATPWTSDGKRWTVTLRPLLPDESDCGDLTSNR